MCRNRMADDVNLLYAADCYQIPGILKIDDILFYAEQARAGTIQL